MLLDVLQHLAPGIEGRIKVEVSLRQLCGRYFADAHTVEGLERELAGLPQMTAPP